MAVKREHHEVDPRAVDRHLEQVREDLKVLARETMRAERLERKVVELEARLREAEAAADQRANLDVRLRDLHRLETLHHSGDQESMFDHILQASVELVGATKGILLRRDGQAWFAPAVFHLDQDAAADPLLVEIADRVQQQNGVLILDQKSLRSLKAKNGIGFRNVAGYSIAVRDRPAGVVIVADKPGTRLTENDCHLLLGIGNHASVAIENRRLHRELRDAYTSMMELLCDTIEVRDTATHGHCEMVAELAGRIGQELGLSDSDLDLLHDAALVHDLGKVAISDGILLKPHELTPAERGLIQTHAAVGADLLARVEGLTPLVPVVRHHHERWDGTGYPDGLANDGIPLLARVLAAADAYSTMLSDRPYRSAVSAAAAIREIQRGSGAHFDPAVVRALERVTAAATDS